MDHERMTATQYRARFDADVRFSNGGGLRADGFRVDVPGPGVTEQQVAALFVASLNLPYRGHDIGGRPVMRQGGRRSG